MKPLHGCKWYSCDVPNTPVNNPVIWATHCSQSHQGGLCSWAVALQTRRLQTSSRREESFNNGYLFSTGKGKILSLVYHTFLAYYFLQCSEEIRPAALQCCPSVVSWNWPLVCPAGSDCGPAAENSQGGAKRSGQPPDDDTFKGFGGALLFSCVHVNCIYLFIYSFYLFILSAVATRSFTCTYLGHISVNYLFGKMSFWF